VSEKGLIDFSLEKFGLLFGGWLSHRELLFEFCSKSIEFGQRSA
jgi:hypothetical protein